MRTIKLLKVDFIYPPIKNSYNCLKSTKRNIGKLQELIDEGNLTLDEVEQVIQKLILEEEDLKVLEGYFAILN